MTSSPRDFLHPALLELVAKLEKMPFVDAVLLFGSRARGDAHPRSDIDLAIECPQATLQEWQQVLDLIQQADTLLPIDCVKLDEAGEALKANILKYHQPLFVREKINHGL